MTTPHDDRNLELLDEAEGVRLLKTAVIGRIAFTEGALPAVQPVAFAVGGGEIFIPTHHGSKVATASRGAVVAFEVDEFDVRARTGWSVTVVGPARLIRDPEEVVRLDVLGVQPWTPADEHCYIGVQIRLVQGRRIRPGPAPREAGSTGVDGTPRAARPA